MITILYIIRAEVDLLVGSCSLNGDYMTTMQCDGFMQFIDNIIIEPPLCTTSYQSHCFAFTTCPSD